MTVHNHIEFISAPLSYAVMTMITLSIMICAKKKKLIVGPPSQSNRRAEPQPEQKVEAQDEPEAEETLRISIRDENGSSMGSDCQKSITSKKAAQSAARDMQKGKNGHKSGKDGVTSQPTTPSNERVDHTQKEEFGNSVKKSINSKDKSTGRSKKVKKSNKDVKPALSVTQSSA